MDRATRFEATGPDRDGGCAALAPAGPDGQTIYAAYIIREFDSAAQDWKRNCYVRRISARSCVADLNLNSEADPNDFDSFVESYDALDQQ